jgi:hypothetical protein
VPTLEKPFTSGQLEAVLRSIVDTDSPSDDGSRRSSGPAAGRPARL